MGPGYLGRNFVGRNAMNTSTVDAIFRECDFCKLQGVLDKSIFNKDGWYYCKPCLLEIEYEMEKRKKESIAG